jgi:hypothetical protein
LRFSQNLKKTKIPLSARYGTGVDLCFAVGWCKKGYTGVAAVNPIYAFAAGVATKPVFAATGDATARDMYYSGGGVGCLNGYCRGGTSAWRGDPDVPFYFWNRWKGDGTPFGWGEFKALLQQVITWRDSSVLGFSTQFTHEWMMYGALADGVLVGGDVLRPKAPWCWVSARGHVLDLQSAPLGTCITQNVCFQHFFDRTESELGCLDTAFNSTLWTAVNVVDDVVQWDTDLFDVADTKCWKKSGERICLMPAGETIVPPMLSSENTLAFSAETDAAVSENGVLEATRNACGCSGELSTIRWPSWLCRVNALDASNGACVVSTTGDCAEGNFNCGTQFGYGATGTPSTFLGLCKGCPTANGILTVGQCMGDICKGINNDGTCPTGTVLCASRYDAGVFPAAVDKSTDVASFQLALEAAGGALQFLWHNGTAGDLFGFQTGTRWMASTVSTRGLRSATGTSATFDGVHCVGAYGANNRFATLESPAYLRGGTVATDAYPGSLTTEALNEWCGAADCVAPTSARRWLCIDAGQSINTPSPQTCALREEWVDNFVSYTNPLGKKVGYYGGTTSRKVSPDCASWVSGLDPDAWCQRRNAFTGCVISRVGVHTETMSTVTKGDVFRGVLPGAWTSTGPNPIPMTIDDCTATCLASVPCVAWHHNGTHCEGFSDADWVLSTGGVNDTVGSAFPVTGGFLVPRTSAGPVVEMDVGTVARTYPVSGIELFAVTDRTVPHAHYKTGSVACTGTFFYYGTSGSSVVRLLNTSVTACSIVSDVSAYETDAHKFPAKPLVVRVLFSAVVLGLLTEDWGKGFGTFTYSQGTSGNTTTGRGRGLRGVLRTDGGPFRMSLINETTVTATGTTAQWLYNNTENVTAVVPASLMRTHRRACVPVTLRQTVSLSTMDEQASVLNIYRRDPVDCIVAGAMTGDPAVSKGLFAPGGACYGTQGLAWPSTAGDQTNNVAKVSNLNYFSWWSWAMQAALIFYNTDGATTTVLNNAPVFSSGRPVTAVPNCGTQTADCTLAYDLVGYTPCTGSLSTVWFTCMKPTMMALYPLYEPDFSVELSTPFSYPDDLYVTAESVDQLDANAKWTTRSWSQYMTMVHYCDRYSYDGAPDEDDAGINGWKQGKFVSCDNDPFDNAQRLDFCRTRQPWWVVSGLVFKQFSFADLCPFTAHSVDQYCFVFADHPQYPTVSALIGATLPNGLRWEGTTFYYVPVTLRVLSLLMYRGYVVNTLITNNIFTAGIKLNTTNYGDYGPTAERFSEAYMRVNRTSRDMVDNMCDGNVPLAPDVFRVIYTIVRDHYDAGTDTYTFGATADSEDATTVLTASEVEPLFPESNALLQYDGLTLTGLVAPARIGTPQTATVNQVRICTRFQIDGIDITVSNMVFDQSKCILTGALQQTPIVFSGAYARGSIVHDITVIDSAAAVAVLGGDSLVYTYTPIIDADGLRVYDVRFVYTGTNVPLSSRRTVAVLGRMTGVPTVSYCSAPVPEGYTRQSNCQLVAALAPGERTCTMPNECLELGGCCGRLGVDTHAIARFECEYGLMCAGNATKVREWFETQPNAKVLCNADATGCTTGVEDCITTVGDCYYNRSDCRIEAAGDLEYRTGGVAAHVHQSWQYNNGGQWYPISPGFKSSRGGFVHYVDGVGYERLVWTVRSRTPLALLASPANLTVHAEELAAGLGTITVIPRYSERVDGVPSEITQLVLMVDWFMHTANKSAFNTSFMAAIQAEWCVGVRMATGALEVTACGAPTHHTDWLMDVGGTALHVVGYPQMCATRITGALHWLPCQACAMGDGNTALSATVTSQTQLFIGDTAVTTDALVPVDSVDATWVLGAGNVSYRLNADLQCLTCTDGEVGWMACNPDLMFPENRAVCDQPAFLVGVFRYVCTQGYGGTIHTAVLVDPTCVFEDTALTAANGVGGSLLRLDNSSLSVLVGGAGYLNGETVVAGKCEVVVYSAKVIVQPLDANFSLASAGVEVIDFSEITGLEGAAYVEAIYAETVHFKVVYQVVSVVVAVFVGVFGVLVVAGCVYKQVLVHRAKNKQE